MSSGLQVEKIDKMQDVKAVQSTSEPSVDSERSQGDLLRVGNGQKDNQGSQLLSGLDNSEDVGAKTLGFPKVAAEGRTSIGPKSPEKVEILEHGSLKGVCEVKNLGEVPSPASARGNGPQKMSNLIGTDSIGGELASNGPGIWRKPCEDVEVGGLSGGGNHRVGPSGDQEE
jgi:hypothetical protein